MVETKKYTKMKDKKDFWKVQAIIWFFGFFLFFFSIIFVMDSPVGLKDELEECQKKLPSWNIRFECDYGDFLGDEGFQLSAVSNLTFSNYTLYKNTLKGLEFLDEECEVLE